MAFRAYLWWPDGNQPSQVAVLNVSHHKTTHLGFPTLELTVASRDVPRVTNYVGRAIGVEIWRGKAGNRDLVLARSQWRLDRLNVQATLAVDPAAPNLIMSMVGVDPADAKRINAMWDRIGDTDRPPPMPALPKFSSIAEADAWMAEHEASARAARDHTLRGSSE